MTIAIPIQKVLPCFLIGEHVSEPTSGPLTKLLHNNNTDKPTFSPLFTVFMYIVCLYILTYFILQVQVGTSLHQQLNDFSMTLPDSPQESGASILCDDRHV